MMTTRISKSFEDWWIQQVYERTQDMSSICCLPHNEIAWAAYQMGLRKGRRLGPSKLKKGYKIAQTEER